MTYPVFPQVTDYLQRSLQNPILYSEVQKKGGGLGGLTSQSLQQQTNPVFAERHQLCFTDGSP